MVEPVDLVDEQDVAVVEVGEDRRQVAGPLESGPRGDAEVGPQLVGHDLGQRGLAQTRPAAEKQVVDVVLAAAHCGTDQDLEMGLHPVLADELRKRTRA